MTDAELSFVTDDAKRFDAALARLESALAASIHKVADMARHTGFEDGVAHAIANEEGVSGSGQDLMPVLREELEAARSREANLQTAVSAARDALNEAMADIRAALGPL